MQRLDEAIAAHPDIPPQFQERYDQIRRAYNRAQASNDTAGMILQGHNASVLRHDIAPTSTSSTSSTQTVQPPSATTASVGPAFPGSSRQHRSRRGNQQLSEFLDSGAYPGPMAPYVPSPNFHFPPPSTTAPNPFTPEGAYVSLPPPPGRSGFYQHGSFSTAAIAQSPSSPYAHGQHRLRMSTQTFGTQDHSSSSGSGHGYPPSVYSRGDSRHHSSYSLHISDAANYEGDEAEASTSRRSAKGKGKGKAGRR